MKPTQNRPEWDEMMERMRIAANKEIAEVRKNWTPEMADAWNREYWAKKKAAQKNPTKPDVDTEASDEEMLNSI